MNHNRCCAYDNANSRSRSTLAISATDPSPPLPCCCSTSLAIAATVGSVNTFLNATSTPSRFLTRDTTCVANSECPPSSKKLSSIPTFPTLSTSSHIPLTISSTAVRGPTYSAPPPPISGFGNALRSTFPFGVRGISVSFTITPGTIASGNLPLNSFLISCVLCSFPSSSTTYPPRLLPLSAFSPTSTAASRIPLILL